MPVDDLGIEIPPREPANRVVSLVPSLTETLAVARPEAVVGATDWCTHPADLGARRVRGTKNPDIAAIVDLQPDLVLANREENRRIDVDRLRAAGLRVWVTDIDSVGAALASIERLFREALDWPVPAWLATARQSWTAPPPEPGLRAAAAIWRDPWMVVGSPSFADDVLRLLGVDNPFRGRADRYPKVTLEELDAADLDLLILPDEPYQFSATDGPEALPGQATCLVSGRLLTWYGPSLESARSELTRALRSAHIPNQ